MGQTTISPRFILVIVILAVIALATGQAMADTMTLEQPETAPAVKLQSRTFVPAPGLEAGLLDSLSGESWHGLIQFEDVPSVDQRATLASLGVTLLRYVPELTWVARLPANPGPVLDMPGVRWIGDFRPADKIDRLIAGGAFGDWARNSDGSVTLWVNPFPGVNATVISDAVAPLGGQVVEQLRGGGPLVVKAPAAAVAGLAMVDGVEWITQMRPPAEPLNDGVCLNSGADVAQAAPYSLDGSGVQVAIWDAGEIAPHVDFDSRLTIAQTGVVDSHATHIAGTVAGTGVNSDQGGNNGASFEYRGVAPGAEIISYQSNNSASYDHDEAINVYGADVSQNAWGYGICSWAGMYDYTAAAYDSVVRGQYGRGVPVVFATGNWGTSCGSAYGAVMPGPASAKNTITVGNVNHDVDMLSNKTAWGPVLDGRLKPEIVAPGGHSSGGIMSTVIGDTYGAYVGSSMSSAAVSGGIALVLEHYHDACTASGDSGGNPLPSTVKGLLIHSATDLVGGSTALTTGPDFASGFGKMNIPAAVNLVPYHVEGSVSHGVVDSYTIVVAQQDQLKVTLTWDDVAAAAYAAVTLVNDLNLQLIAPDGTTVYGPWQLDPTAGNEGNPATRPSWPVGGTPVQDARNTVEQVAVDNPTPGTWTIQVVGSVVPSGPQPYSLVSEDLLATSCTTAQTADTWLKDSDTDSGVEPNQEPVGLSQDIWVQLEPLAPGGTPVSEIPQFGSVNYVYANVRNQSAETVDNVQVLLYWADHSVGLTWPTDWHLMGRTTVVNVPASDSVIMGPVVWDLTAAPEGSAGTYSLYARLLTPQDPLLFVEAGDTAANAQQSNNIARRDTPVIDPSPTAITGLNLLQAGRPDDVAGVWWVLALGAITLATLIFRRRLQPVGDVQ